MYSTITAENGRPHSTTAVCIALKLPAYSKPAHTNVVTAAQNTRSQAGASSWAEPPWQERLAIISVPESTGVRNSTKLITTTKPAVSWV